MIETCTSCGNRAQGKNVDFGLGLDEAWGRSIRHTDVRYVSDCCHADIIEHDEELHAMEGEP